MAPAIIISVMTTAAALRKLPSMVIMISVVIILIPIQTIVSALNITIMVTIHGIMTLHLFLIITVMLPNSILMARPAGDMNTKTVMCPQKVPIETEI